MDKNTVLIFSDTVLKRYEEPLNTIFLYNVENDTIWAGNSESFAVLALVDGQHSIEQISFELHKNYPETDFETILYRIKKRGRDYEQVEINGKYYGYPRQARKTSA